MGLLIVLLAAPVGAAPPADTSGAAPTGTRDARDARAAGVKSASKLRRSAREDKRGFFEAPGWVMMRSLVVPGWGQLHNRAWLKAVGVATGEIWMGLRVLDDRNTLNRIEDDVSRIEDEVVGLPDDDPRRLELLDARNRLVDDYNSRLESSTARQWLLGGLLAYALLDAYVDAHFRGFQIEFEADPALEGAAGPQLRVAIRGAF